MCGRTREITPSLTTKKLSQKTKSGGNAVHAIRLDSATPPPTAEADLDSAEFLSSTGAAAPPDPFEPRTVMPDVEGTDYSQARTGQQTPIANFWQWVDPWLRDLTVEDLVNLKRRIKVP